MKGKHGGRVQWIRAEYLSSRGQVTGNSEGSLLQPEGAGTFYCFGFPNHTPMSLCQYYYSL